jgi:hypothetical protein
MTEAILTARPNLDTSPTHKTVSSSFQNSIPLHLSRMHDRAIQIQAELLAFRAVRDGKLAKPDLREFYLAHASSLVEESDIRRAVLDLRGRLLRRTVERNTNGFTSAGLGRLEQDPAEARNKYIRKRALRQLGQNIKLALSYPKQGPANVPNRRFISLDEAISDKNSQLNDLKLAMQTEPNSVVCRD